MAREISEDQVPLAGEDRFLIISIKKAESLVPGINQASALGDAIKLANPLLGNLTPVFDLRGLPSIYNDVEVFIDEVATPGSHVLVNSRTAEQIEIDEFARRKSLTVLRAKGSSYRARHFDMSDLDTSYENDDPFVALAEEIADEFSYTKQSGPPTRKDLRRALTKDRLISIIKSSFSSEPWNGVTPEAFARSIKAYFPSLERALAEIDDDYNPTGPAPYNIEYYLRSALFHAFLRKLLRNSLMVELVMTTDGNSISCSPYHASALYGIQRPTESGVLIGRPGQFSQKTNAVFSNELTEFQQLINDKGVSEQQIQSFLEKHHSFLRGLNYSNVYPQLVLDRDDGSSLRPDFILEPFDDEWCDILDIKLPQKSVIVGRDDRKTLAAAIHEVAAQLTTYAAYFDEEKHRKFVREKYGLKVYKPRLIAVVGRSIADMGDPDMRRAMTMYNDVKVMTFDDLARHAQSRLLI